MTIKKEIKRRDFIGNTLKTTALAGIISSAKPLLSPFNKTEQDKSQPGKVIHRPLGKTGINLPIVSMGVMNANNPELLKRAYQSGIRYFDTAAFYQGGQNEKMVGSVIKELNIRGDVVIGTKVFLPPFQRKMEEAKIKDFFINTAHESLKRLQTDLIDILYVHNVSNIDFLKNPGVRSALVQLKNEGKIRSIGFSTHSNMEECIHDAISDGFYQVILTTFNYSMYDNANYLQTLADAHKKGIGLVGMKTQCQQPWYWQENVPTSKHGYFKGEIMHTALLKWALNHDFISTAIPGYTTFDQLELDFPVAKNLGYSAEEKKFLGDRQVKTALLSVCQQCRQCLPSCPRGVDIPILIRTHMYAACYGNFHQARQTLNETGNGHPLNQCRSCRQCTAGCVRQVNIAQRINELRLIFG